MNSKIITNSTFGKKTNLRHETNLNLKKKNPSHGLTERRDLKKKKKIREILLQYEVDTNKSSVFLTDLVNT